VEHHAKEGSRLNNPYEEPRAHYAVNVPTISSSGTATIYVYYGNPAAT